ncbi:MAG: mannose-1-phosphate guanylyltransferase/mannose-6-phosphate isomerase [Pseudomonadales bacterium]|jgi:mannose-1-phosphate guanylyltransferase
MSSIQPVIMAGGSGSRLWPLSRAEYPKQFLPLLGEDTLLQTTLKRAARVSKQAPIVLCNEVHRFVAAEQIQKVSTHNGLILEPVGRNTAPAIALAALHALSSNADPILLVLAADHHIENSEAFEQAVKRAQGLAQQDKLVTFGIVPTHPETGYGYIQRGSAMGDGFAINTFVEKPELSVAQDYLASGDYWWNSGMFCFKASVYLAELKRLQPEIYAQCEAALANTAKDLDFLRIDQAAFEACPSESIDYAVMEHTPNAAVVPLDAGWSDIGGFSSLWEVLPKNEAGNAKAGPTIEIDTQNSLLYSESRLIAAVGVSDLLVVDTADALLVAAKDNAQAVKQVVAALNDNHRFAALNHRKVARPWGTYDAVDEGEHFKVKRITVKPHAKLSLQMHHHRAEHWVVVSGVARVTNGDEVYLVNKNESTFIPVGQKHSLENPSDEPLELIEVQSGDYLGEDDIVRFDDWYGRSSSD